MHWVPKCKATSLMAHVSNKNLAKNGGPDHIDYLLVKGLTTNHISKGQLSHQGIKVNFSKVECLVSNKKSEMEIRGVRTIDNCYNWISEDLRRSWFKEKKEKFVASITTTQRKYGPPKAWSNEILRSNKRKLKVTATSKDCVDEYAKNIVREKRLDRKKKAAEMNNDYDHDVEEDVHDIRTKKVNEKSVTTVN